MDRLYRSMKHGTREELSMISNDNKNFHYEPAYPCRKPHLFPVSRDFMGKRGEEERNWVCWPRGSGATLLQCCHDRICIEEAK